MLLPVDLNVAEQRSAGFSYSISYRNILTDKFTVEIVTLNFHTIIPLLFNLKLMCKFCSIGVITHV